MEYSIVYLNYDPDNSKDWVEKSKQSIFDNSKMYNYEFIEIKDVLGYVNAVNEGFKKATGRYIFFVNDDVIVNDKLWIARLSNPDAITSWRKIYTKIVEEDMPDGSLFCVDRNIYDKIGGMDIKYGDGYGCDEIDYFLTARDAGFELIATSTNILHLENKTMDKYFRNSRDEKTIKNLKLFKKKWGK